jgi:transcription initiation factor TFIIE subunit alpha
MKYESVIQELVGSTALPLFPYLKAEPTSEIELSKKLDTDLNDIRNKLYKLADHNIVLCSKKRDKIKGWYVYYWALNEKRLMELETLQLKSKIRAVERELKQESTEQFYICRNECQRLGFEDASCQNFECPECGQIMQVDDNSKKVKNLEIQKQNLMEKKKEMSI